MIEEKEWKWYGHPGHFICAFDCRFHLCTEIGEYLVSTVGEYLPEEGLREKIAKLKGVILKGKGNIRRYEYLDKIGFEDIVPGAKYETKVFTTESFEEKYVKHYNNKEDATEGHLEACYLVAKGKLDVQNL